MVFSHWPIHSCFFFLTLPKKGHSRNGDSPLSPKWTYIALSVPGGDDAKAQVTKLRLHKVDNEVS